MRRGAGLAVMLAATIALHAGAATAKPETPPPGHDHRTTYPGRSWEPDPATYGVYGETNRSVPMKDGVNLTVDVFWPAAPDGTRAGGTFPVLLTQTPYTMPYTGQPGPAGTATSGGETIDYFVSHGYIYVAADVRGTGRSGGDGEFLSPDEVRDGETLTEWAADPLALEGSNGVVGLHGCSYLGATQLYTAATLAPDTPVRAMIPACTKSDPYRDTYMVSGIPAPQWEGAGLFAGALLGPTIETSTVPKYLESQQGGDAAYYGDYWRARDHTRGAQAIAEAGIATLLWNGWNDAGHGGLELLAALQNAHFGRPTDAPLTPDDEVSDRYQLIVGDWGHGGGLDLGVQLQWYETWLRGVDTGIDNGTSTPIHLQDPVTGDWFNFGSYPLTTRTTAYHLHAAGGPGSTPGTLAEDPAESAELSLVWAQPGLPGTVLSYETAPRATPAVVAGPSALRVVVSSSGEDLQLMADLYDVAPDGTATPISHGGVLGTMRATDPARSWSDREGRPIRPYLALTREAEQTVEAGEKMTIDVPLRPIVWRLDPGHRLRLRLVGQEETSRCTEKSTQITIDAIGCRARAGVQARLAGTVVTVHHGESYLNLPLLSGNRLPKVVEQGKPTDPNAGTSLPLKW